MPRTPRHASPSSVGPRCAKKPNGEPSPSTQPPAPSPSIQPRTPSTQHPAPAPSPQQPAPFPRPVPAQPPAAPLRGAEGSAAARRFSEAPLICQRHMLRSCSLAVIYAPLKFIRGKSTFQAHRIPPPAPFFSLSPSVARAARVQSLPEKPGPIHHPACHPLPSPPSLGTPPLLPGICEQKKTSSGFLASATHRRETINKGQR